MMDTGAIYLEVCSYGRACRAGNIMDEADHMQMIASLLRNADEEHKTLLADNERLMSERDGLRAARIAYASEFPPILDGGDAGLPDVGRIHENIRRLKAENAELKAELE